MGKNFSTSPTGSNRIGIDAQHELRYWRQELGCSEDALRDAVAAVSAQNGVLRLRAASWARGARCEGCRGKSRPTH
jgi:Protein of unknown function (DUF3606)